MTENYFIKNDIGGINSNQRIYNCVIFDELDQRKRFEIAISIYRRFGC